MGSLNVMSQLALAQGLTAVGESYANATAAKTYGEQKKREADINARLAELNADDAVRRGDKEAEAHKRRVKQLVGAQRAALAAQGIEIDADSALDVQEDTKLQGELDVQTIKNNAWREAWGYKVQANNYTSQGKFAQLAGKAEATSSILTGGAKALQAGLKVKYYEGKEK